MRATRLRSAPIFLPGLSFLFCCVCILTSSAGGRVLHRAAIGEKQSGRTRQKAPSVVLMRASCHTIPAGFLFVHAYTPSLFLLTAYGRGCDTECLTKEFLCEFAYFQLLGCRDLRTQEERGLAPGDRRTAVPRGSHAGLQPEASLPGHPAPPP